MVQQDFENLGCLTCLQQEPGVLALQVLWGITNSSSSVLLPVGFRMYPGAAHVLASLCSVRFVWCGDSSVVRA